MIMTNCVRQYELTDEQLIGFLDGESTKEVEEHLKVCEHCQNLLEGWSLWQSNLKETLERADCPNQERLGEYNLGFLERREAKQFQNHLASCQHCSQELDQLNEFLSITEPARRPSDSWTRLGDWLHAKLDVFTAQVMIPNAAPAPTRLIRNIGLSEQHLTSILYKVPQHNGKGMIGRLNVKTDAENPEKRIVDIEVSAADKWQAEVWRTAPDLSEPEPVAHAETELTIGNLNSDQYTFILTNNTTAIYIEDVIIP